MPTDSFRNDMVSDTQSGLLGSAWTVGDKSRRENFRIVVGPGLGDVASDVCVEEPHVSRMPKATYAFRGRVPLCLRIVVFALVLHSL